MVVRLRDGTDHQAWSEFLRDYGPMLYRFVRSRGLQDADAADIVQDVVRRVGMAIQRLEYQKEKGGFRAWLFAITRNRLSDYFSRRQRQMPTANDTRQLEMLSQAADHRDELNEQWELEYVRQLASRAMEIVEPTMDPKTWEAFRATAIDGRPAAEVGDELGMSPGAVYVAKSRVTQKLRAEIQRMQGEDD